MWDDADVDFTAADLVVLRATWDYSGRRDEFLAWCDDGAPLLLELELTEPYLGFAHADSAASSRFASAVRAQLG